MKQPQLDADEPEQDAVGGERKSDRIADQKEDHQRPEHHGRHVVGQQFYHAAGSPRSLRSASASCSSRLGPSFFSDGSGIKPRKKATRLISSEIPCRTSRRKPIGTIRRAGQTIRPPALDDSSWSS